jgi:hypothetical protein
MMAAPYNKIDEQQPIADEQPIFLLKATNLFLLPCFQGTNPLSD